MAVSCTLWLKRLAFMWAAAVLLLISIGETAAQPKNIPVPAFVWLEFPTVDHMEQRDRP